MLLESLAKLENEVFLDPLALLVLLAKTEKLELRDPQDLLAPLVREVNKALLAPLDSRVSPALLVLLVKQANLVNRVFLETLVPPAPLEQEEREVSPASVVFKGRPVLQVPVGPTVPLATMVLRVMLVPLEPLVARVPLAFKECLVNEVQLVFQALRVTEGMLVPKVLMVLLAKMASVV